MGVFTGLFRYLFSLDENPQEIKRRLMRQEAAIGSALFGKLPKGRKRDFFYYDDNVWIWHERWEDKNGQEHVITTRYEVQADHVLKIQDGQPYQLASDQEVKNLHEAAALYHRLITQRLYT